jgi:Domain of unknown function (DUF3291)
VPELAHLNVVRLRAPLEDPLMADFTNNIERINRLAELSDGFVWRLEAEGDSTYGMAAGAPDVILTLSVWESVAALRSFVFKSEHADFLRRRREWFLPYGGPYVALWWVPDGTRPTLDEAMRRLAHLAEHGPSAEAFTCASVDEVGAS